MTSTLSSKGQLTVPRKVREHLRLKKGDKVDFTINEKGEVVLQTKNASLLELWDILPKSDKKLSIEETEEAIAQGWLNRWHRSQ